MEQGNVIIVDHGVKTKLENLKLGRRSTINKALNGYVKTPQALRIRQAALDAGGVEIKTQSNENTTSGTI